MFGLGGNEVLITLGLIYSIFVLLIPVFLYLTQKWTYKSYLELKQINKQLLHLLRIANHTKILAEYYAPKLPKSEKEN